MIKRRKTPYGLYIAALVFFMVLGYLISGLYTIPDLSIVNFQEYLYTSISALVECQKSDVVGGRIYLLDYVYRLVFV